MSAREVFELELFVRSYLLGMAVQGVELEIQKSVAYFLFQRCLVISLDSPPLWKTAGLRPEAVMKDLSQSQNESVMLTLGQGTT